MQIHNPHERPMILVGGALRTEGHSLKLPKGVLAITDEKVQTKDGIGVVSSFAGYRKDERRFRFQLGTTDRAGRTGTDKSSKDFPWAINDVISIEAYAPSVMKQQFDDYIFGFDGTDPDTSLTFETGKIETYNVELYGTSLGLIGYSDNKVEVPLTFTPTESDCLDPCVDCDPCVSPDCKNIVWEAIKEFRKYPLKGGYTPEDLITITPVGKCDNTPVVTTTDNNFWCLETCDIGDDTALALIQEQYPTTTVVRKDRVNAISKYEMILPAADGSPSDYAQTLPSIMKDCEDCPAGYTEVVGGYIYAVTLEDDGVDLTATVATLTNYVSSNKENSQVNGVGLYTVVTSAELTPAEISAFVDANATATVTLVGSVESVCENPTVTNVAWTNCGTCKVSSETYEIWLHDDSCGEARLVELQAAYPNNVITLVEQNAEACASKFQTTVPTNMVCEECSPIFEDFFTSEAPENYNHTPWTKVTVEGEPAESGCLCGIRFVGKPFMLKGDECTIDQVGYEESSVQIRISRTPNNEVLVGTNSIKLPTRNLTVVSRAANRTGLGGNLRVWARMEDVYDQGEVLQHSHEYGNIERAYRGQQSKLRFDSQYVFYNVQLRRPNFKGGFGNRDAMQYINRIIMVEYGYHKKVEALLNDLASAAGLPSVQATA